MTTLRHSNQMWRISSHHTTLVDSAAFLGNAVDVAALVQEKHAVEREADVKAHMAHHGLSSSTEKLQRRPRSMKDMMVDVMSAFTKAASSMHPQHRSKQSSTSSAPFSVEVDFVDGEMSDDDDDSDLEADGDVAEFEPPHPSDYPLTRVVLDTIREAYRQGLLSSEHRDVLTDHLIHGLVTSQKSAVEVAYEVIFGFNLPPEMQRLAKSSRTATTATLKSFADQCKRLASQL